MSLRRMLLAAPLVAACTAPLQGPSTDPPEVTARDGAASLTQALYHSEGLRPKTLSLTYDDGPDRHTLDIARYLASKHIRATFFVNGCRIKGPTPGLPVTNCTGPIYPESWLAELVRLGHRIGNHSQDHLAMSAEDGALLLSQLQATQDLLDRYIGDGIYLFRPPYSSWSPADVAAVESSRSLRRLVGPIGWDIDGGDWACWRDGMSVAGCGRRYLKAIERRPDQNGIVLLHDRPQDAPGSTRPLQLTRWLVHHLEQEGFRFVGLEAIPDFPMALFYGTARWSAPGDFSDSAGFAGDESLYGSVRIGDVNGDRRADVCARTPGGIVCALSTGAGFLPATPWMTAEFTDALGWRAHDKGTTIQLADVNGDGKADVCGRSAQGIVCATARADGTGFEDPRLWSSGIDFSDADGFGGHESRWGTIRFADVNGDGKADVCARTPAGIVCALSTGTSFEPYRLWLSEEFGDAQGWSDPAYATTIQLGDVDGDGRADVCGRSADGIVCATVNAEGSAFEGPSFWSTGDDFSDADGWGQPVQYRSLRLADVNGDGKADVCGRSPRGLVCALSTGEGFKRKRVRERGHFSDGRGWAYEPYGTTVQFGDLDGDGKADVCARESGGMLCALAP